MHRSTGHIVWALLLLGAFAGCGGGSSNPPPPPPPTVGQIYVTKVNFRDILRFRAGDNGNVAPQQTISPPSASTSPLSIDVAHNRLAGTSFDGTPIVVFIDNASTAVGQSGAREISGAATTMHSPGVCALDGPADVVYVVDSGTTAGSTNILVFGPASSVSGNVAPVHTLVLPYIVAGIAVDPASNRLFVADSTNSAINIYDSASTLNGAVTPNRTIAGALTQLASLGPLAFESSGHLVVGSSGNSSTVRVFNNAGALNGNVGPSAVFSLANNLMAQIAVTPAGDLYVVNGSPQILVFSNIFFASGTISPVRIITGPNTNLDSSFPGVPPLIEGIAIDPTR